ncbi:hypothetical protein NPIL_260961 [Nephila pilipes]|uniref:Uncharacterized protein n=1 Tax=Nephila pilipes TaxID=299642 RepID=A0A8X6QB33_NEPPI|nr:hypothetical protein NPIL_260961 [Nephila pilipes]
MKRYVSKNHYHNCSREFHDSKVRTLPLSRNPYTRTRCLPEPRKKRNSSLNTTSSQRCSSLIRFLEASRKGFHTHSNLYISTNRESGRHWICAFLATDSSVLSTVSLVLPELVYYFLQVPTVANTDGIVLLERFKWRATLHCDFCFDEETSIAGCQMFKSSSMGSKRQYSSSFIHYIASVSIFRIHSESTEHRYLYMLVHDFIISNVSIRMRNRSEI